MGAAGIPPSSRNWAFRYSAPTTRRWTLWGSGPQLLSQHPIRIGDVTIHSGDYVLADRDGIVIIPQALVEAVTVEAEEVLRKENLVRKAILQGVDPVAAYLQYGKF